MRRHRPRPWDWKISMIGAGLGALIVLLFSLAIGLTPRQAVISAGGGFTIAMALSWLLDRKGL